jgi:CxxC motif-containing protein
MAEMICIVCPRGCRLSVTGSVVTGNGCPRGAAYGREETSAPKRTLTATCPAIRAADNENQSLPRRVPVKTSGRIPRELGSELAAELYRPPLAVPVKAGTVVIADWRGTGVSVVVTRTVAE